MKKFLEYFNVAAITAVICLFAGTFIGVMHGEEMTKQWIEVCSEGAENAIFTVERAADGSIVGYGCQ